MFETTHIATKAIHAGSKAPESVTRPQVAPVFASSVFVFDSFSQFDPLHNHTAPGFTYSRTGNPGVTLVEEAVASLENAEAAVAYSSGMAAISLTLLPLLHAGDHIVCANVVYGSTSVLIKDDLSSRGIESTFVDSNDLAAVRRAARSNTKVLFCELISNPLMEVADLVVHSATKYLNGHNDVTMGVTAVAADPVGPRDLADKIRTLNKTYGACPSPFDAWLLLRGIRTLSLRVERHCDNALKLASFLASHPKVKAVNYPGLDSSPFHALGRTYFDYGFGGMLSFETEKYGVGDGLIRVSVGLEDYKDIERDFDHALARVTG